MAADAPVARARAIELIKLVPNLTKSDGTSAIPGYKEWVIDLPPGLTAYHAPIGKGLKPAGSNSSSSGYLISTTYYDTAMQDAKVRVALAGARLAKLLNENLK